MASYNRVIIMGNLTRDPEHKQLSSGQSFCKFGLASNRQFKNRQTGDMIQEVCFVDIDVWGPQADSCNQYLQKGRGVLVEGRLKFDTWQDKNGQNRSKHSVVADRVTFLPAATSVQSDASFESQADLNSNNQNKFAAAASPKKMSAASENSNGNSSAQDTVNTGEVAFKDEKPFEDDLPF